MIKICGNRDNINEVLLLKPDLMGFIFVPESKRSINSSKKIKEIRAIESVKKVGVFSNACVPYILSVVNDCRLDFVQLHGEESVEYCKKISKYIPVIKAVKMKGENDFLVIENYKPYIQYALLDASFGGSGQKINRDWLNNLCIDVPFFIAGGISLDDISEIQNFKRWRNFVGVDVNSKFEDQPGLKNTQMLNEFINKIKNDVS